MILAGCVHVHMGEGEGDLGKSQEMRLERPKARRDQIRKQPIWHVVVLKHDSEITRDCFCK